VLLLLLLPLLLLPLAVASLLHSQQLQGRPSRTAQWPVMPN
jgi:hypothetical protein